MLLCMPIEISLPNSHGANCEAMVIWAQLAVSGARIWGKVLRFDFCKQLAVAVVVKLLGRRKDEGQKTLHLHRPIIQYCRLKNPTARRVQRRAAQQWMAADGYGFNDASFHRNGNLHLDLP